MEVNMSEPTAHQGDPLVHLTVGGFSYTTTRSVLLATHHAAEETNYFRTLLSGRWTTEQTGNEPDHSVISERDGRLFFYILYYLQLGELPRRCHVDEYTSLLTRSELLMLTAEASFYGLEGLVKLCHKPLQVLQELGSVGDIDVSPYSDISVYINNEHYSVSNDHCYYRLEYKYKKSKTVEVVYRRAKGACAGRDRFSISLSDDGKSSTAIVDKKSHLPVFRHIQKVITKMYGESKRDKKPTVSAVLAEVTATMIPAEVQLWWALEVHEMISYYDKEMNWEFEFGVDDDCVLEFLDWDRSWALE